MEQDRTEKLNQHEDPPLDDLPYPNFSSETCSPPASTFFGSSTDLFFLATMN